MKKLSEEFEKKKKPILEKRDLILEGNLEDFAEYLPRYDVFTEKLQAFCSSIVKDEEQKKLEEEEEKDREPLDVSHLVGKKGVPDFWRKAMTNNPMMAPLIQEHDKPILEHLTGMTVTHSKVPDTRFQVEMHFEKNDFFDNVSLSLTAIIDDQIESTKEVIGETINWKDGKDITKQKIKKTQKNKKTGQKRVVTKTVPQDSLFNIFESKKQPENPDSDGEDSEEEVLLQRLQDVHEFCTDAYDMYMGEALEHYLYPDTSDLAAMLGGLQGDEDDDSDSDDEKDKKPKKKSKKGEDSGSTSSSATGKEGADGKKEECKQQ